MSAVDVLWTAGWDSTFRVADLLFHSDDIVRPWYVVDPYRRSATIELETQDVIRRALADLDPTATRRLLPAQIVTVDEIPQIPEITEQFRALLGKQFLGGQYEWLARLAESRRLVLELSIHRDDRAHKVLAAAVDNIDGSYRLVAGPVDPALEMFRRFRFPLFETTKLEMGDAARDGGFLRVMELTWFCHSPLRGKPCGCCNPCRYTRAEGLGRRVPPQTRGRLFEVWLRDKALIAREWGRRIVWSRGGVRES